MNLYPEGARSSAGDVVNLNIDVSDAETEFEEGEAQGYRNSEFAKRVFLEEPDETEHISELLNTRVRAKSCLI